MSDITTPAAPAWTPDDFATAFLNLLPNGPIWPREPGAVLVQLAEGMAPTYARLSDRAAELLQEAPAGALTELLPEWEATLGLPDICSGPAATITQRRAQVDAVIMARGGQSVPYFVRVAASLGYQVTVTEFAPARADVLRADDPVYDPDWAYAWRITSAITPITYFSADLSFADEPLASWGSPVLECTLRRLGPAHCIPQFAYAPGAEVAGAFDTFTFDRDTFE